MLSSTFVLCVFSTDEDEELHSTDPESKEKSKDKKTLCKVKWSRDEVSLLAALTGVFCVIWLCEIETLYFILL